MDPPAAAARKPCCVCDAPGGLHCTKCKSRHYCGKACQLVDWYDRGHKAQCRQLAVEFQDRLLDALMPEKLKIKEEPAIVADVLSADGSKAAARLSALQATAAAAVEVAALNDNSTDWRGSCAVCLDLIPVVDSKQVFYPCCCKKICSDCSGKCAEYDTRCPLCLAPAPTSNAEMLRRVQKHVDEGNAEAQTQLGDAYRDGDVGLKQSWKRAIELYELAAAQGHPRAQTFLGHCYEFGNGVRINYKTAVQWYRRAAEQGYPEGQCDLGMCFCIATGVAQSFENAVKWYRLAAAQGFPQALFNLGMCLETGQGVPRDVNEALRLFKRAAAKGHADAAAAIPTLVADMVADQ